ncbi:uncharacterized protein EDB93DRAFT_848431 [Suillus bovinus]|uniref:uncharacterized protein n=1 Tax=Suillus bovinus TaxID=48563 RepID=UPI001B872757|nr:uncharacterized protein EDB93DRAFT_848431 [Suillus bovinus]KAG2134147.1 hypothetical protein EDB93DRAFT_848431 [Suillus bovinus]
MPSTTSTSTSCGNCRSFKRPSSYLFPSFQLLTNHTMNNDFPALYCPAVVNDLAHRLGSLPHFLDAINDVMKFGRLEDHELQHYSRKIIALTENARITLRREGVALYMFILCSEELLPYKSVYFKLLLWIRCRRPAFPADMGDRITSLLFVLESNFVIRCGGVDTRA